ncbi:MAG: energy transducer TonB [Thermodesulfobacteriota bacterium]
MEINYHDITLDEGWGGPFKWFLFASIIFHLAVLYFCLAVLPDLTRPSPPKLDIFKVNLITLPAAPPPAPAAAVAAAETTAKTVPVAPPVAQPPAEQPTEAVPVGPVEKPPEPIKKIETPPPEPKVEVEKKPPKEPEKTPEKAPEKKTPAKPKENPDKKIAAAIDNLKAKKHLEDRMAELMAKHQPGEGDSTNPQGVPGGRPSDLDPQMQLFFLQIYNIINSNWIVPPEDMLDKSQNPTAVYRISIDPSGKLAYKGFRQKSGQDIFDLAVETAVGNSEFPPPPEVFGGKTVNLNLLFTLKGVRGG